MSVICYKAVRRYLNSIHYRSAPWPELYLCRLQGAFSRSPFLSNSLFTPRTFETSKIVNIFSAAKAWRIYQSLTGPIQLHINFKKFIQLELHTHVYFLDFGTNSCVSTCDYQINGLGLNIYCWTFTDHAKLIGYQYRLKILRRLFCTPYSKSVLVEWWRKEGTLWTSGHYLVIYKRPLWRDVLGFDAEQYSVLTVRFLNLQKCS